MRAPETPGIALRGVCLDYPMQQAGARLSEGEDEAFSAVGGHLTEFRGLRLVRALDDITVEIGNGDRLALLGGNGSGKSTLLKVMAGLLPVAKGSVRSSGRIMTLFNTSVGIDSNLTGLENLERLAALHGLPRSFASEIKGDVAEFTQLGGFLKMPLKTYSAGMRARFGFAFATAVPADILLIDEVVGAGDESFFQRARDRLTERLHNAGIVVLASHSASILRTFCSHGLVLHRGSVRFIGEINEAIHTHQLLMRRMSSSLAARHGEPLPAQDEVEDASPPPPPPALEHTVRPGQKFELLVTARRTGPGSVPVHVPPRAWIAAFEFRDAAGALLEGTRPGFMPGTQDANFCYVTGAQRKGRERHTLFEFDIPEGAHGLRIVFKPIADPHQQLTRTQLDEVADRRSRGMVVDQTAAALRHGEWDAARSGLGAILSWPAADLGYDQLRVLERELMGIPRARMPEAASLLAALLERDDLPRAGLTDRIAAAWVWLEMQVGTLSDAAGRRAVEALADRLLAKLGDFSGPLIAKGATAMLRGDRAEARARFRRAAAAEGFDAPIAKLFAGAGSIPDHDELMRWGEDAIGAAESGHAPPDRLEWLAAPPDSEGRAFVLVPLEARSFVADSAATVSRVARAGGSTGIHFHVVNWTMECERQREVLQAEAEIPLAFTAEAYHDRRDRHYPAIAACLRAREIQQRLKADLVLGDLRALLPLLENGWVSRDEVSLPGPEVETPLPWMLTAPLRAEFRDGPLARSILILLESYVDRFFRPGLSDSATFPPLAFSDVIDVARKHRLLPPSKPVGLKATDAQAASQ